MKGLPISYFKDLQDDKALVFDGFDTLRDTLIMSNELIKNVNPNKNRMSKMTKTGYTTATAVSYTHLTLPTTPYV